LVWFFRKLYRFLNKKYYNIWGVVSPSWNWNFEKSLLIEPLHPRINLYAKIELLTLSGLSRIVINQYVSHLRILYISIDDISAKSGILFCEKGSLGHDAEGGVSHPFEQNKISFSTHIIHYFFYKQVYARIHISRYYYFLR